MSYEESSFSLASKSHGTNIRHNRDFDYHEGYVVTPNGIVGVYAQGGSHSHKYTRLDLAIGGRQYMREFDKQRLTPRGLVTAAKRFAADIVGSV